MKPILIENDEDGFFIPLFKGCHTYSLTRDEAIERIREVIRICLEETGGENYPDPL